MYPKVEYIIKKIEWFQKYNPKVFHKEIWRQLYELYAPLVNSINIKHLTLIGGNKYKDIEFIQEFHGYKFRVNIRKTKYDILINILTHKDNNPLECGIINIDRERKLAYLNNISYYEDCLEPIRPDYIKNKSGSLILRFILDFLKRNKTLLNINRIALKDTSGFVKDKSLRSSERTPLRVSLPDNSIKSCPKCKDNIELGKMYFLLYGNTWYGKYGFRPYDIRNDIPDKRYIKSYIRNQKIVIRAKVKDVKLVEYILRGIKKHKLKGIDVKYLIGKIKKWDEKKLSDVLKTIMRDYDKYCCLFTYIQDKIFDELRLQSFHNFSFYLDI